VHQCGAARGHDLRQHWRAMRGAVHSTSPLAE